MSKQLFSEAAKQAYLQAAGGEEASQEAAEQNGSRAQGQSPENNEPQNPTSGEGTAEAADTKNEKELPQWLKDLGVSSVEDAEGFIKKHRESIEAQEEAEFEYKPPTDETVEKYLLDNKKKSVEEVASIKKIKNASDLEIVQAFAKDNGSDADTLSDMLGLDDEENGFGREIVKLLAAQIRTQKTADWSAAFYEIEDASQLDLNLKKEQIKQSEANKKQIAQTTSEVNAALKELPKEIKFSLGRSGEKDLGDFSVLLPESAIDKVKAIMLEPSKFSERFMRKNADTQELQVDYGVLRDVLLKVELFDTIIQEVSNHAHSLGVAKVEGTLNNYPNVNAVNTASSSKRQEAEVAEQKAKAAIANRNR